MFKALIAIALVSPLVQAVATLKPGIYHLVNLGHPYAPASVNHDNRVALPQDFSGNYDLWEVVALPGAVNDGVTIQNLRGNGYARIPPPAEVQFVPAGSPPSPFSTTLSGTADIPGDDAIGIPDIHIDYWTIGTPGGLVWTYNNTAGPEISLRPVQADRTAGQYWIFAAPGVLPFLSFHLRTKGIDAFFSPHLAASS
ncbi:hypothetical protein R3P38DRAFT_3175988 [Favolaschia claudopus]|uniref:Uncharacterized protein n=1 Tax=Favolaschia claudopus TaxID=2862362 RepID=A0AAW0D5T2_9AGAR